MNPRKVALLSQVSLAAAIGTLPSERPKGKILQPAAAPELEWERGPDGKARIIGIKGNVSEGEKARILANLVRVAAARDKRIRKAQKRMASHG